MDPLRPFGLPLGASPFNPAGTPQPQTGQFWPPTMGALGLQQNVSLQLQQAMQMNQQMALLRQQQQNMVANQLQAFGAAPGLAFSQGQTNLNIPLLATPQHLSLPAVSSAAQNMHTQQMLLNNALLEQHRAASSSVGHLPAQSPITQSASASIPMNIQPTMALSQDTSSVTQTMAGTTQASPKLMSKPAPNEWSEYTAADGRKYYHNAATKQSKWQKPDELKTEDELRCSRDLAACEWKEYKTEAGKVYYNSTVTKKSVWEIPPELKQLREKLAAATAEADSKSKKTDNGEGGSANSDESNDAPAPQLFGPAQTAQTSTTFTQPILHSQQPQTHAGMMMPSTVQQTQPEPPSELEKAMQATLGAYAATAALQQAVSLQSSRPQPQVIVYADKKEAIEAFKQLLRDFDIPNDATWDFAVKKVQKDPRYRALAKLNERKQAFNAYKTQRLKEQRDDKRLAVKRAKETLEQWLQSGTTPINSTTPYRKADQLFVNEPRWTSVPESSRKEIYADAQKTLAITEKEEAKKLRTRNIKTLADLFDNMEEVTFKTTWSEAQRVLMQHADYANDKLLQVMDKEDSLIVFQEHIRSLEDEELKERAQEQQRQKRQQRKNREAFAEFLEELHSKNNLDSTSLWCDLYASICGDDRFLNLLGQPGSTPLDLFKFYVEDLKARFTQDKQKVREIIKEHNCEISTQTSLDDFRAMIQKDERAKELDSGNVKLCFQMLIDKAEAAEKEKEREVQRKRKRLYTAFKSVLAAHEPAIGMSTKWEEVQKKVMNEAAYKAMPSVFDCEAAFNQYITEISEACGHHHVSKKKKKKEKSKRRHLSDSEDVNSEVAAAPSVEKRRKHDKSKKSHEEKKRSSGRVVSLQNEELDEGEIKEPDERRKQQASDGEAGLSEDDEQLVKHRNKLLRALQSKRR